MEGITFGKVEKMEVELELDEKFKGEATREKDDGGMRYYHTKNLNIQTFDIKQFSNINFIDNIDPIVDHIQQTISDHIDGIKFKNDDGEYIITTFHNDEKYRAKKIGEGGFGMVSMTSKLNFLSNKIDWPSYNRYPSGIQISFAMKKIINPTKDALKEIAYNQTI